MVLSMSLLYWWMLVILRAKRGTKLVHRTHATNCREVTNSVSLYANGRATLATGKDGRIHVSRWGLDSK